MQYSQSKPYRIGLILMIVFGSLAYLMTLEPIRQDTRYHDFADQRLFLGTPNMMDVISNLPFLVVGLWGVAFCINKRCEGAAWILFFLGVALVGLGSAYYHWHPNNSTLVWDRLPMTLGFMAMFAAILGESIHERLGRILLVPALLVGVASVVYWSVSDDLRFYAWVQFMPLVTIPFVMALFPCCYSHRWLLLPALGCYMAAKVFETYDYEIFIWTHSTVAGHAIKHIFAAAGCLIVLGMLSRRIKIARSGSSGN